MNLQDLRYLVALAEHRHFGRAAEACHVSQPTMSNQIRKLEQELGVTLLERTNKRVDLTPVGAQILHHARQALIHTGQMEALARAARDPLVGPGSSELDFSATKSGRITEGLGFQFRAEFFNILNHTNFLTPNPVVYTSATSGISPTAGVITATSTTARQIQFGAKLQF